MATATSRRAAGCLLSEQRILLILAELAHHAIQASPEWRYCRCPGSEMFVYNLKCLPTQTMQHNVTHYSHWRIALFAGTCHLPVKKYGMSVVMGSIAGGKQPIQCFCSCMHSLPHSSQLNSCLSQSRPTLSESSCAVPTSPCLMLAWLVASLLKKAHGCLFGQTVRQCRCLQLLSVERAHHRLWWQQQLGPWKTSARAASYCLSLPK